MEDKELEEEDELEELDTSILNVNPAATSKDVASGQHMVDGDHWSHASINYSLKKQSLGLTSIPASTTGGEVLALPGIPENPGLKRDEGDEIDYFGGNSELVDEIPPGNYKYQNEEDKPKTEYEDFVNFLNQQPKTANYFKHLGRLAFYFKGDPKTLKKLSNIIKK